MIDTADLTNAEIGDTLVLRCGGCVTITCIDDDCIWSKGYGWHPNGVKIGSITDDPLDCIELIKKPKPKTVDIDLWMNVDSDGCWAFYDSKYNADMYSHKDRIACINIKRTVIEGDGL